MSRLPRNDEILIARYLDGELSAAQREGFESRVAASAALESALQAAAHATAMRRRAAAPASAAPAGFAAAAMSEIVRQPARADLVRLGAQELLVEDAIRLARGLLVAAVVVVGLLLVFSLRLLPAGGSDSLSATEQEMRALDQRVIAIKEAELRRRGEAPVGPARAR